jgi:signal transduction histidine kinase
MSLVERNCISKDGDPTSLIYWSEVIFAKCVFLLTPLSLLALIPALIMCIKTEAYLILGVDMFCFFMLFVFGYAPGISVKLRKFLLLFMVFLISFILLKEFGSFGPGLVFLLSATVFMLLFFPGKNPLLPFILTLFFCVIYGIFIHFRLFEPFPESQVTVMAWIAVSSNVLFLSALFTLMIPFFFSKLESIMEEKVQLLEAIRKTNSELEKSIAEVNSKNSQLEEYAFVASHDLQEQLRMISSFQTKLATKYKDQLDQKAHQYIYFATEGAHRMKQIILELLNHASAGKSREQVEKVNLKNVLDNYMESRSKVISEKSVLIEADNLPVITAAKAPLVQTIACLLDNAITYSKPDVPPKIKFNIVQKQSEWLFSVEDNGIGIEKQFFDKIFIIFQRLHNRDQYSGTGVGLAIAKKNVEFWGGQIWIESIPNHGSAFYFTIPKSINKSL